MTLALAVMALAFPLAATASGKPSLDVFVGYADSHRASAASFPTPWNDPGNPQVIFEGCQPASSCAFDSAAVRLVNNSGSPVTVNSVKVEYSSACVYDIWPHDIALAPGRQLILTQTKSTTNATPGGCTSKTSPTAAGYGVLDGSDIGPGGRNWDGTCTQSGVIPQVDLNLNGASTAQTFADSGQVLNTRGVDGAYCPGGGSKNESVQWTPIGSVPCLGSAVSLSPSAQTDVRGAVAALTAHLVDGCGNPLQGSRVSFRVFGAGAPNSGWGGAGTTDSRGSAAFSYPDTSTKAGRDQVQATVKNPGGTLFSNVVAVNWANGSSSGSGGSKVPLGLITRLSLRPSTFAAAPSGPSTVRSVSERKFGTVLSYRDSQSGITSIRVLKSVLGHRQGKSCVRGGSSKHHGRRCFVLVAIGYFTHQDVAGSNRFRFTGRIRGHGLSTGDYVLEAVPHDAAGTGTMRSKSFRVVRK
jgi:hypothetical protein